MNFRRYFQGGLNEGNFGNQAAAARGVIYFEMCRWWKQAADVGLEECRYSVGVLSG